MSELKELAANMRRAAEALEKIDTNNTACPGCEQRSKALEQAAETIARRSKEAEEHRQRAEYAQNIIKDQERSLNLTRDELCAKRDQAHKAERRIKEMEAARSIPGCDNCDRLKRERDQALYMVEDENAKRQAAEQDLDHHKNIRASQGETIRKLLKERLEAQGPKPVGVTLTAYQVQQVREAMENAEKALWGSSWGPQFEQCRDAHNGIKAALALLPVKQ
jgi:small-conductance mechanosensitive channel